MKTWHWVVLAILNVCVAYGLAVSVNWVLAAAVCWPLGFALGWQIAASCTRGY